ncbi:FtsX-like permease family protein [Kribbella qitaiheensis]|uniref:FtsX-like permease family protein n=1 Tax=Kribbella qitaiheensis TaxID=1544730 RepID=A0A7G6X8V0_9ACTN|nr:FtsX-like permease family protein [Kribbella qitaiheensis]QNE22665.1 FtsX-like permease family protein [Kribbella qitaiheensis]
MIALWMRGLIRYRGGRLLATAVGVSLSVALIAALGAFLTASKATMTTRAASSVAIDWQVEVQSGGDPASVLAATRAAPGVGAAEEVAFGRSTGFEATTGGSTQTTGPGVVLGLPAGYRAGFPGEIRTLTGGSDGVLLAQQTAANLHAAPGDSISIGRPGLTPVTVKVDGVIDLPQADSLFQKVGAPPQSQPSAPPDNVLLLPRQQFDQLLGPVTANDPEAVKTQIHVRRTAVLPPDPASAYTAVVGAAHNLEAALAGAGLVGDNLGAALDAARGDASYAQILFLFLGVPGAVLAALLTAALAGSGAIRRRREQALLRVRGLAAGQVTRLAALEAGLVGVGGGVLGLVIAAVVGRVAFGTASFGANGGAALLWFAIAFVVGLLVAAATVLIPAVRDLSMTTINQARQQIGRLRSPQWMRFGLDFILLVVSLLVFRASSNNNYSLVLAPEGVPTISVSYWAFFGPALLWVGGALLLWRLTSVALSRGRGALTSLVRPLTGTLATTTAASMSRQRRPLIRSVVLLALAVSFAVSTATFNATYKQQAEADALLTNGADVTVTESPGVVVGPEAGDRLAATPGVRKVEPIQHRFAYVGSDLQDLYGVRPASIAAATALQDAYFVGGTTQQLMGTLAKQPDAILVSDETVKDFQLAPGDLLRLRLQDSRTKAFREVAFHYAGVVKEFPTAPHDSFFVANADYVAKATGSNAVGAFLLDTGGGGQQAVAAAVRHQLGASAKVTDLTQSRSQIGSSLTSVDLAGLTRFELAFAVLIAAGAGGLVLALGLAERRRAFAIAAVLGAGRRQLRGLVLSEAIVVTIGGLAGGALLAWALTRMLVKVLTGVFDPPPSVIAVPWPYLSVTVAVAVAAILAGALLSAVGSTRPPVEELREL